MIDDFSGGINMRDAPSQLAPNESPELMNVTLDERGAIQKRLGSKQDGANEIAAGADASALHYSTTLGQLVIQVGDELYRRTGAGTYTEMTRAAAADAFTTTAPCHMADFNGILYMVHPADGILRWDGANIVVVTAAVKGVALAVWQNKLWAGGPWSDGSNSTRVWWSNAGDGNTWTTASDFVDIRDLNDMPVTALGNGQMMDTAGAGSPERSSGLLVFKERSTYRISDSATGEYATLSGDAGASNARSVCSLANVTAFVNRRGIWMTDGLNPPVHASEKLRPLFTHEALSSTGTGSYAAGCYRDRMFFSIRRAGQSENDLTIEFDPDAGWMTIHNFGFTAWDQLDDGQPYAIRSTDSFLYRMFTGGTDWADETGANGDMIMFHYQTAWLQPAQHYVCRFRRLRVSGLGEVMMFVRHDYNTIDQHLHHLDLTPGNPVLWDDGNNWNEGHLWGPVAVESFHDHYSHGYAKAIAFHFHDMSDGNSTTTPPIYRDGPSLEVGNIQIRSIQLDFIRLAPS